jgi:hypothetical protein
MIDNMTDARIEMNAGPQPLDAILQERGLSNHQLVVHSGGDLTHKVVQKGRKGRRLTRNAQEKILRAINIATASGYSLEEVFNYRGR